MLSVFIAVKNGLPRLLLLPMLLVTAGAASEGRVDLTAFANGLACAGIPGLNGKEGWLMVGNVLQAVGGAQFML